MKQDHGDISQSDWYQRQKNCNRELVRVEGMLPGWIAQVLRPLFEMYLDPAQASAEAHGALAIALAISDCTTDSSQSVFGCATIGEPSSLRDPSVHQLEHQAHASGKLLGILSCGLSSLCSEYALSLPEKEKHPFQQFCVETVQGAINEVSEADHLDQIDNDPPSNMLG